ncbi:MAG: putative toxin-antitoxin system toxin component, PIN family [Ferruginibacter sp.]
MPGQKDSVIIDTNLWISFLLTKDLSKFDSIIADNEIKLIFSQELVDEIVEAT